MSPVQWRPFCLSPCVVGFDHGFPCHVKNMARGTQKTKTEAICRGFCRYWDLRIGSKQLLWFREKYCTLGHHVCKICEICGQKMGSNMRRYIQFHDICNRDISGVHCISIADALEILQSCTKPSICVYMKWLTWLSKLWTVKYPIQMMTSWRSSGPLCWLQ